MGVVYLAGGHEGSQCFHKWHSVCKPSGNKKELPYNSASFSLHNTQGDIHYISLSVSLWEKKRDSTLIKHTDKFIQVLTPLFCLSSYFAICCRPWGWNMYIEGKVLMPNFFVLCTSILWTRMFGFKEKSSMTYKINTLTQISWQLGCMYR